MLKGSRRKRWVLSIIYFTLDHFFKDSFKSVAFLNIGLTWNFTWEHAAPWQSRNTLGHKLQRYVVAINHSLCGGRATQQHVAATRRSDKSLGVVWRMLVKIFVSTTKFCRCNKSRNNQIRLNLYHLLWQQNSVAETEIFTEIPWYTRSDLSLLQLVAKYSSTSSKQLPHPTPHRCATLKVAPLLIQAQLALTKFSS